jgi:curli biogenesis system outer membrane secretion channel CsgG
MTDRLRLACIGSLIAALLTVTTPAAAAQPSVLIVDFELEPAGSVLPPPHLGSAMAQLLLDRLVTSGQYRVLDGRWLQSDAPHPGRPHAFQELIERAEAAHVDYLILGSVTRFSTETRQRSLGGLALAIPLIGGVGHKGIELAVSLVVRVIDVRTGEVMTTATAEARAERKQHAIGGLAPLVGGPAGALVTLSSSGFRDALLDQAMQRAVATTAQALVSAAPQLTRRLEGLAR